MVPTAGYLDKSFSDSFLLAGYSLIIGNILAWAIIAFCCLAVLMTLTLAYKSNDDNE